MGRLSTVEVTAQREAQGECMHDFTSISCLRNAFLIFAPLFYRSAYILTTE